MVICFIFQELWRWRARWWISSRAWVPYCWVSSAFCTASTSCCARSQTCCQRSVRLIHGLTFLYCDCNAFIYDYLNTHLLFITLMNFLHYCTHWHVVRQCLVYYLWFFSTINWNYSNDILDTNLMAIDDILWIIISCDECQKSLSSPKCKLHVRACVQVRLWLTVVGASLVFGPVATKAWRVYRIFKYGFAKKVVSIHSS